MLLALALIALPTADFTLTIDGGLTNSARTLNIPAAPPGMTHLHLEVDHVHHYGLGLETDEVGPIDATYVVDAEIVGNWSLKWAEIPLTGRRTQYNAGYAGDCVPFDGVYDWSGASGQMTTTDIPSNASVTISTNLLALGQITLGTRASATVAADLAFGIPWGKGWVWAMVTYLTISSWTAEVRGTWLP